jgi:signal recognition particle subunit SRP54
MFDTLAGKFQSLFAGLSKQKKLTEENLADAVRDVRLALLDADVNYSVVSRFVKQVKEKAIGEAVIKSVTPAQQFVKIVHDELIALMGAEEVPLKLTAKPAVILMCGLQGCGKTTQAAKLAAFFKKKQYGKRVLIAACDLQRPAAVLQLKALASKEDLSVFAIEGAKDPIAVAKKAYETAKQEGYDLLIVDTAGRLHVDEALMQELEKLKKVLDPQEIFFVASSATGQDAIKTAIEFDKRLSITGSILTMLDGTAKAGVAISIREVTQKPLRFEGIGEKISDLQLFNPRSMADRILGMGDVINLVRTAEEHIDEEESKKLEEKLKRAQFTYDDYLKQMAAIKKMGPLKNMLKMLPGLPDLGSLEGSDEQFKQLEAMILSMTPAEREERVELIPSRRHRIAKGSGTTIDDVNRMIKKFKQLKQFIKEMPKFKKMFEGKR